MGLKKYKATTPSLRYRVDLDFDDITKSTPEKSLLAPKKRSGGRNNRGRITAFHRGGGHKQHYRIVDFKRKKYDIPAMPTAFIIDQNGIIRFVHAGYTIDKLDDFIRQIKSLL